MKKSVLLLLICFPCFSFGGPRPLDRKMIGLTFSPEYSYRLLSSGSDFQWLVDLRNEMEIPKLGYTIGFDFQYRIKKKLFMIVSACYSNQGEETKKSDLIYNQPEDDAPVTIRNRYSFGFLEIPVKFNYQFFDTSSFFTSLGLLVDLPVIERRKSFYTYSDGSESKSSTFTFGGSARVHLSGIIGIGYFFKVGKQYFIKTEPFFKCNITPGIGNNVHEYLYSYGLEVGFYLGQW